MPEQRGLAAYRHTVHMELMRDSAKELSVPEGGGRIRTLRVWHCKYRSLAPIAELTGLEGLEVATVPDSSLAFLSGLRSLRYLRLLHLPHVTDLSPLADLTALVTLRLDTLPSWDSSGKKTVVDSIAPVAELPRLRHLELFGIVPADGSLRPLERAPSLKTVRLQGFARREQARFYEATGLDDDLAPDPDF